MPDLPLLLPLIQNVGIMAVLAVAYAAIASRLQGRPAILRSLCLGLVFGLMSSAAMLAPLTLAPGLIFDTRSIPLILAGPFGGPWAAVLAAAMTGATRALIGGSGVAPAFVGLTGVVLLSIGLWALRRKLPGFGAHHLALGGLACLLPITAGLLLLGLPETIGILSAIGLPLAFVYTLGAYTVGWLLLAEDRREAMEQELQQAYRLAERASQAKSQFLAQVSHELRTPMAAILGALDLLSMERLKPDQAALLDVSRRSAEHLVSLLNELLDLSKVEAGRLTLNSGLMNLSALLAEVQSLYEAAAQEKGLRFRFALAADLPQHIHSDRQRLRQILTNLLGNALKFTSEGLVELHAECATDAAGNPRLRIMVRDTGPGIPLDQQASVFEPFVQTEQGSTRSRGGTGLGLTISRELARALGGEITVESAPGLGSRFTLDLPLEAVAAAPQAADGALDVAALVAKRPLRGRRILLAEDVVANRAIIVRMLESLGAEVVGVGNGQEAVAVAPEGFDVILMDMHMPVMDGTEATRRIRALPSPTGEVAIFALSADATPENRRLYTGCGLTGFLTKPVDWAQLVSVIEQLARPAGSPREPADGTDGTAADAAGYGGAENGRAENGGAENGGAARTTAEAERRWDDSTLRALEAALGAEAVADLLAHVPESLAHCLESLRDGLTERNAQAVETRVHESAHALKGMAANLGFNRLAALAAELESVQRVDDAQALMTQVEAEAAAVAAAVRPYGARSGPDAAPDASRETSHSA